MSRRLFFHGEEAGLNLSDSRKRATWEAANFEARWCISLILALAAALLLNMHVAATLTRNHLMGLLWDLIQDDFKK